MQKTSRHFSQPIKKLAIFTAIVTFCGAFAPAQDPPPIDNSSEYVASDDLAPPPQHVGWNEYDGKYWSIRVGGGFLVDHAAFAQDDASKDQIAVEPKFQLRDARLLFRGKLKFFKGRSVNWSAGIMWNQATSEWQFRQSGLTIAVPEIWGQI